VLGVSLACRSVATAPMAALLLVLIGSAAGVPPEGGLIDVPLYITGSTVAKTFTVKLTSASPSGNCRHQMKGTSRLRVAA
jgi:hypothetical protein